MTHSPLDISQIWLRHYNNRYFNPLVPHLSEFLASLPNLNGHLLDIGCGDGEKSNLFTQIGYRVTAIDHDPAKLQKARECYPDIGFQLYEIRNTLPFPDNTFDVIFAFSVIQYLDHQALLPECRRILKPGGSLILIANLKNNPFTATRHLLNNLLSSSSPNLQSYYTPQQIKALKQQFGAASLSFHHLLTPLAHLLPLRMLFPFFSYLDKILLKIPGMHQFTWLALLTAINKE